MQTRTIFKKYDTGVVSNVVLGKGEAGDLNSLRVQSGYLFIDVESHWTQFEH